ncbi:hypothetical protein CMV_014249 [Castanea mollissima]|uniref:Uncharacterized protein n=1 Tax=Castanea mollissima TaxID=60419 RepID=A0A8J4RCE2_9ROSI|nr:hypothetical protein CMV_014249 [Castanea mollissima]
MWPLHPIYQGELSHHPSSIPVWFPRKLKKKRPSYIVNKLQYQKLNLRNWRTEQTVFGTKTKTRFWRGC